MYNLYNYDESEKKSRESSVDTLKRVTEIRDSQLNNFGQVHDYCGPASRTSESCHRVSLILYYVRSILVQLC